MSIETNKEYESTLASESRPPPARRYAPGFEVSIATSILLLLIGVMAIAFPWVSTLATGIFIAWILLFRGIVELVEAAGSRGSRGTVLKVFIGALYLLTGGLLLLFPYEGIVALTLILAVFLVVEGLLETVLALELRTRFHYSRGWGWLLADGLLTLVLGGLIWLSWPSTAPWAIGLLIGVAILSTGLTRLLFTLMERRARRHAASGPGSPAGTHAPAG